MWPPLCLTMPYTVARPRPVPWPTPLVVKNGSKTWASTSSDIPQPVSVTDSMAYRPGFTSGCRRVIASSNSAFAVATTSRPPFGMASRAFAARFSTTCPICVGSAFTWPRSGAVSVTNSMSDPISRFTIAPMSRTTAFRFSTLGTSICLRLNAMICCVRRGGTLAGVVDVLHEVVAVGGGSGRRRGGFRCTR